MRNEEFGFARLSVERPLRPIWKVDEKVLEFAPAALRERLKQMLGESYPSKKVAEEAILKAGFEGKEAKSALKAISTTDPTAQPLAGKKHAFEPDSELRDYEAIQLPIGFIEMTDAEKSSALKELAENHLINEIHQYVSDAWIDHSKTKVGYEIPFTRQFYTYPVPRPVADVKLEISQLESEIQNLMKDFN
jgi:type I restriction enzyme M protein